MDNAAPLQVTTPNDLEVVVTRAFDAPRELVFDAWTKPELVQRWLLGPSGWTMPVCEVDPQAGGRIRYEWHNTDGRTMGMSGVYRELVRSQRIVHTEIFDEDWTGGETLVTTEFTERGGRTTVSMTVQYASRQARDAALKTGMTDGMNQSYAKLDAILASMSRR
jgi:uncharacterized protein YndB with AHSA1/START domain